MGNTTPPPDSPDRTATDGATLAGKLAAFAATLSDAERQVLHDVVHLAGTTAAAEQLDDTVTLAFHDRLHGATDPIDPTSTP